MPSGFIEMDYLTMKELRVLGASFIGVLDVIIPSSFSSEAIQWAQRCQALEVNADNESRKLIILEG